MIGCLKIGGGERDDAYGDGNEKATRHILLRGFSMITV